MFSIFVCFCGHLHESMNECRCWDLSSHPRDSNVWCIKIRTKDSSKTLLSLVQFLMHLTLDNRNLSTRFNSPTRYFSTKGEPGIETNVSISSGQRNLMKTYHNDANTSEITKIKKTKTKKIDLQNCKNLTFKVIFLGQKLSKSLRKKIHWRISI